MELIDVLDQGNRVLKPKAILAAYDNYIELAIVQNNEIGAFAPLTKEALIKFVKLTSPEASILSIGGLINKNVLYVSFSISNTKIAFKMNAHKRTIFIEGGTVKVNVPNLIMVIKDNSLYVYSYRGYLNNKTILYKAPFSNFTGGVAVCFGNVKIKHTQVLNDIISNYTEAYWNSQFEMSAKKANQLISNNWNKKNKETTYKQLIDSL